MIARPLWSSAADRHVRKPSGRRPGGRGSGRVRPLRDQERHRDDPPDAPARPFLPPLRPDRPVRDTFLPPPTRTGITHKFSIAGFEGYLTANTYDDHALGEPFINDVGKEALGAARRAGHVHHRHLGGAAVRRAARGPRAQPGANELEPEELHASPEFPMRNRSATPSAAGSPHSSAAATSRPSWRFAPPTPPAHHPGGSRCFAAPSPRSRRYLPGLRRHRATHRAPVRPAPAAATTPAAAGWEPRGDFFQRRPGTGGAFDDGRALASRASASLINRPGFADRPRSVNFFVGTSGR